VQKSAGPPLKADFRTGVLLSMREHKEPPHSCGGRE